MYVPNHSLKTEFSGQEQELNRLCEHDKRFAEVAKAYDFLTETIEKYERNEIPTSDEHLRELKVHRVELKDIIYSKLNLH